MSDLQGEILVLDKQMLSWHWSNEASSRLADIPGVGPVIATTLVTLRNLHPLVTLLRGSGLYREEAEQVAKSALEVSRSDATAISDG